MLSRKYGSLLTVVLVIAIIIILAVIGKLIYSLFDRKRINDGAEEIIAEFDKKINDADRSGDGNINGIDSTEIKADLSNFTYGGYNMMGYIEIPAIDIKYPVLEKVTTHSIEIAVAILHGPGLNQVGNTVIIGHNYKNGVFFSDLNKLKINDIVYITDRSGTKVKYRVYNIFSTNPEDSSFFNKDTDGKREITLETCSDTASMRTVVEAREASEEDNNIIPNQNVELNNENNKQNNNENANENNINEEQNNPNESSSGTNDQVTIEQTEIKPR